MSSCGRAGCRAHHRSTRPPPGYSRAFSRPRRPFFCHNNCLSAPAIPSRKSDFQAPIAMRMHRHLGGMLCFSMMKSPSRAPAATRHAGVSIRARPHLRPACDVLGLMTQGDDASRHRAAARDAHVQSEARAMVDNDNASQANATLARLSGGPDNRRCDCRPFRPCRA